MWQAIITGISSFLTSMFGLLSSLFSGVVSVFYTTGENGGPTILLEVIIFGAAAALVAAAVYVIVRLIRAAVAKLRGGVSATK